MAFSWKRPFVAMAMSTLPVTLFVAGMCASLFLVFNTPRALKAALKESGIYTVFVSSALSSGDTKLGEGIPAAQAGVKQAVVAAVSPAYLEQQTNTIIDGIYRWLHGDSRSLEITIDAGEIRTRIEDNLTTYLDKRLANLPPCTGASQTTDPWSATCLPPDFDRSAAVQAVRTQIEGDDSFLKDTTIRASDIKDKNGRTIEDRLRGVPSMYRQLVRTLLGVIVFSLGMAAVIIFLSPTRRSGLKRLAWIALIVGALSSAAAWLITALSSHLITLLNRQPSVNGNALPVYMGHVLDNLAHDVRTPWFLISLTLALLGLGTVITMHVLKRREERHDEVHGAPESFSASLAGEHASEGRTASGKAGVPKK